jgi:hypothetical protein
VELLFPEISTRNAVDSKKWWYTFATPCLTALAGSVTDPETNLNLGPATTCRHIQATFRFGLLLATWSGYYDTSFPSVATRLGSKRITWNIAVYHLGARGDVTCNVHSPVSSLPLSRPTFCAVHRPPRAGSATPYIPGYPFVVVRSPMTVLLPIAPEAGPSRSPVSFAAEPEDVHAELCVLVKQIRSAKRIVAVCGECSHLELRYRAQLMPHLGAGISTAADIPDFRSAEGLFGASGGSAKGKGRAHAPDVRDLFHVKCLSVSLPFVIHRFQ